MNLSRRILGSAAIAVLTAVFSPAIGAQPASAELCPDVEVVFARGTFEPPGIGATGEAFVDSLRFKLDGKSVDVYAVNYPASLDFATERLPADHRQHRAADHRWQSLRRQDHGRLHPLDPICSPSGGDNGAHTLYAVNGMTDRAADFVARHLTSSAETSR